MATRAGWTVVRQRGDALGERLAAVFASSSRAARRVSSSSTATARRSPSAYLRRGGRAARRGRRARPGGSSSARPPTVASTSSGRSRRPGAAGRACPRAARGAVDGHGRAARGDAARRGRARPRGPSLPLWIDIDDARDLPVLERLTGAAPSARRAARAPARGLPPRHEPLRPRLPPLLQRDQPARRRRARDGAVEGRDRRVRRAGRERLRLPRRRPAAAARPARADRARHRPSTAPGRASSSTASSSRETAEALAAAGHGRLRPLVSIDGPREVNDALRGAGNHAEVFASIADLQAAGLEPVANTVLVEPVLAGLPRLARELAAGRRGPAAPHPPAPARRPAGPASSTWWPTERAARRGRGADRRLPSASGSCSTTCPSWRRRVGGRHDFCASGCRDLAIDPYGRVYACAITCRRPGVRRRRPRAASRSSRSGASRRALRLLRAAAARDRDECAACAVVDACGGECWMQAHYAARAAPARRLPRRRSPTATWCDRCSSGSERHAAAAGQCVAAGACGGQAAAGEAAFGLFDCI